MLYPIIFPTFNVIFALYKILFSMSHLFKSRMSVTPTYNTPQNKPVTTINVINIVKRQFLILFVTLIYILVKEGKEIYIVILLFFKVLLLINLYYLRMYCQLRLRLWMYINNQGKKFGTFKWCKFSSAKILKKSSRFKLAGDL